MAEEEKVEKAASPAIRDDESDDADAADAELAAMKARVAEMEAEAKKLREMHATDAVAPSSDGAAASSPVGPDVTMTAEENDEDKEAVDSRSIYIGNVDYGATPEEIQAHFQACGTINRVTILCDRFTGHPKGYAYVEFSDPSLVENALVLNESLFRGRALKVTPKRTNVPGMAHGARGGRGRGAYRGNYRGGGGGRGGYAPYRARGRGRGRGY